VTSATGKPRSSATSRSGGRAARAAYECDACGHRPAKWVGRCTECGEWGSIIDSTGGAGLSTGSRTVTARAPSEPARPIATISAEPAR